MTRRQLISSSQPSAALILCFAFFFGIPALPAEARISRDVDRRAHLDAIREQLDLGEWNEANRLIRRAEQEILRESRPMRDDDRHLAELALYLAVVEANRGDRDAAEWYWYVAFNLHQPTAYRDVSGWGRAAEVFDAIEVRDLRRDPKGIKTFRAYPGRDFEEPKMPTIKVPDSLGSSHALKDVRAILVEVFLDERGVIHSPRAMGRIKVPILYYSAMVQIFEKKWKPARSEGEPVPMIVELTLPIKEPRW